MNTTIILSKPKSHHKVKGLGFLLLISPLTALIIAIRNFGNRDARKAIFAIYILYGLTMKFAGDSVREAQAFVNWHNGGFSDLWLYLGNLYYQETSVDFIQDLWMFLLSRLSASPSIYFGTIAALYGFFQLGIITRLYDRFAPQTNKDALIFLVFFSMLMPIFYIHGSRWALALWVYAFAIYNHLITKERKYLYLLVGSMFVHFSFFGPVFLYFAYLLTGRRNSIFYLLIILSFVFQQFAASFIGGFDYGEMQGVQQRISSYTNADVIELRQAGYQAMQWYATLPIQIIWMYFGLAIYFARRSFPAVKNDILLETIYSFALILFAFANALLNVPSGDRFRVVFLVFAVIYMIILFAKVKPRGLSTITIIGLVPMIVYFVLEFRRGLETLNLALLGPLPVSFFTNFTLY